MCEISSTDPLIRDARHEDLAAVLSLLESAGLPTGGVAEGFNRFIVAEHAGRIVGVAGVEAYGNDGLLRSLAVADGWRGQGLGDALTKELLARCHREQFTAIYLLTETAETFFPRYGFERIARGDASDAVRTSREFQDLCPASAAVMVRKP